MAPRTFVPVRREAIIQPHRARTSFVVAVGASSIEIIIVKGFVLATVLTFAMATLQPIHGTEMTITAEVTIAQIIIGDIAAPMGTPA